MSFTDDIDKEVDNIIVDVVNDNDNNNILKRSISVKMVDESENCEGECDNCYCNDNREEIEEEIEEEVKEKQKNIYYLNKHYLKHIFMYVYISYNFINGFYKSLVHAFFPDYFKDDIVNIVKKLESKVCKKQN
tara:strand:- start:3843 stop:4241 length:399 start_codon:yes stop_codon:yes gene_type:complete